VEDIEAQYSTWLGYFHNGISIKVPYQQMEVNEGEEPEVVANGYLYPPLPDHPFDNSILQTLEAIANEDLPLFEESCQKIKDWDFKDPMRVSLVHHASRCKSPVILNKLIQKGADLRVVDTQGFTPLHYASQRGSVECIKALVKHCPNLLEIPGENGETPLFLAVQKQSLKSINTLLSLGANPNAKIINDFTPLLWAIQAKDDPTIMRLLAQSNIDIDTPLRDGQSALELAIHTKQNQVLVRLIELGANVNRKSQGYTPLHLAVNENFVQGVKTLVSCSDTILTIKTWSNETVLDLAKKANNQEIIKILKSKGLYMLIS
jgi:ankyrin repeat protein